MKLEHRTFKTSTNKTIEITTLGSNHHIECNPSDAGNNDRFVIQEVIKEVPVVTTVTKEVTVEPVFTLGISNLLYAIAKALDAKKGNSTAPTQTTEETGATDK